MLRQTSRLISGIVSLALVVGLCPIVAYANSTGVVDGGADARATEVEDNDLNADVMGEELDRRLGDDVVEPKADDAFFGEVVEDDFDDEAPFIVAAAESGSSIDIGSAKALNSEARYTGSAVRPDLQLVLDGRALVEGDDYEITGYRYLNESVTTPVEIGEYTVTVRGRGAYSGSADIPFQVFGNFSKADVSHSSFVAYTGATALPEFTVTLDGERLELGVDYKIESVLGSSGEWSDPENSIALGGWTAKLSGIEDKGYYGSVNVYYTIYDPAVKDFYHEGVTVKGQSRNRNLNYVFYEKPTVITWTGNPVAVPSFTLLTSDGKELVEGRDYTLEYQLESASDHSWRTVERVVDEGWYYVIAKGAGPYSQSSSFLVDVFCVAKQEHDITKAAISGIGIRSVYTGSAVTIDPAVRLGSVDLAQDRDYTLSLFKLPGDKTAAVPAFPSNWANMSNAVYPGHYYVLIAGRGDYIGTAFAELYIYEEGASSDALEAPKAIDEGTGVSISGSLFDEMNVDGNRVRVSVSDVAEGNAVRASELSADYSAEGFTVVGVFDVQLDLFDSEGGVITTLTENLNNVRLTFPVDASLNGRTATVVQLHKDASGAIEEIRATVPVVDGGVTVATDKLSEFVVSVEAEGGATTRTGTKPAAIDTTTVEGETPTTRSASALPNTGDDLALPGMLFVAALAAGASIVALRRETNR